MNVFLASLGADFIDLNAVFYPRWPPYRDDSTIEKPEDRISHGSDLSEFDCVIDGCSFASDAEIRPRFAGDGCSCNR